MQETHILRFFGRSQSAITAFLPLWDPFLSRDLIFFYLVIVPLFPLSGCQSASQPSVCQDWRRPASVRQARLPRSRYHQVVGGERLRRSTTMPHPWLVYVWQRPGNQPVVRVLRFLVVALFPFHHEVTDLKVPVQKFVHIKVFIVIAKRIDQDL